MTRNLVVPVTLADIVRRALSMLGATLPVPPGAVEGSTPAPLQYALAAGGTDPNAPNPGDPRFGPRVWACDCSGFALAWCCGLSRHQDAFSHWGGDISTDSVIEACVQHASAPTPGDWWAFVAPKDVKPGHLLVYSGHRPGVPIGHCAVVVETGRPTTENPSGIWVVDCHWEGNGPHHAVDIHPPTAWLRDGGHYVAFLHALAG